MSVLMLLPLVIAGCAAEVDPPRVSQTPTAATSSPEPAATAGSTATPRPVPAISCEFSSEDCSAPEASQFDFWVGVWDVHVKSANGVEVTGAQTITKEGCLVFEHFDAALGGRQGYIGESISQWVPSLEKWQQRYADNSGFAATYTGVFADGEMILYQSSETGEPLNRSRLVWKDIEPDRLLWHNEITKDGGKTYAANIVIRYERRD